MDRMTEIYYMDFYGELLTEHQQKILSLVIMEDYSLAEVAEHLGITRQGVHDGVQRGLAKLQWFEDHLGLYKKHQLQQESLVKIKALLEEEDISSVKNYDALIELLNLMIE